MEKFGIFELLDTLSALVLPENGKEELPKERPDVQDRAFAPPAYDGHAPAGESSENTALSSFLARHDAAARRADGREKSRRDPPNE